MHLHPERVKFLLKAYSSETATPAEEQELLNWVAAGEAEEQVTLHLRELLEQTSAVSESASVDWDQVYSRILAQRGKTVWYKPVWLRYVAAAVVVFIVAGIWFRQGNVSVTTTTTTISSSTSISDSDSHEVTLTFSNGQFKILDTNANTTVAEPVTGNRINVVGHCVAYQAPAITETDGHYYNILTVPRGKQYELILPDSTHVWLNAESSLRFPVAFTDGKREVMLNGEAYFDVKPNSTLPFLVNAGEVTVRVLGTGFNIMAYKNEGVITTTLVKGSVQVVSKDSVIIKPGEQALVNAGQKISVQTAELERVLAWKSGEFRFDGLTIKGIMRQLERWYDLDVAYQGAMPTNEFYGIFPRKGNASQILDALELTGNIHFKTEGNKILVISGPAS